MNLIHKLVNWDIRKKHIDFTLTLENRLNALKQGEYICIQKENGIFKFAIVPDNFIPAFDLPDEAYKIFKYDVASCVVASATVKHFKGKVYSLEDNILTVAFKSVKDFVNFIESMDYTDVESIITDENLKVKSDFKKAFQENRIMEYINII